MSDKINLGDKARDQVTGYEGVVVAHTVWLHGCVRLTIQPQGLMPDGKCHDPLSFDELQLTLIERAVVPITPVAKAPAPPTREKATGGPRPEPRRAKDAR